MACLVRRSKDNVIKDVMTPDGKKSGVYNTILSEIKDGLPSEVVVNVTESLSPYIGKFINNLNDSSELALGLYANLYSKDFMSWYGEDWTKTGQEPKVYTVNGMKVFRNSKGEIKSIYNTGRVSQTKPEYYKMVATKKTSKVVDYVKKSVQVLNLRIKEARKLRDRVNNDPKLSFEEKTKKAKYFNDIISDAIEKKTQLKEKNELKYVLLLAETDLDMANDVIYGSNTSMGELRIASRAVGTWRNITKVLGVKDLADLTEEDRDLVSKIEARAVEYNRRIVDLSVKLIAQKFSTPDKEIKPEDLYNELLGLPGVDWITSQSRDISALGIPLINLLAKTIQESNYKIDKEHSRIAETIDEAYEKVKNHPEVKANGFNIFYKEQTNVNGDKTLGLVGPYSQKYYDAVRARKKVLKSELETAGSDRTKRREAYNRYNEWISKNTFVFNSIPFSDPDKYTDEQRNEAVNDLLKLGLSRQEVAGVVKESERLYKLYLDAKKRYQIDVETEIENQRLEVPEGMTREQFINDSVERWDDENSPVKLIEQLKQPTLTANYAFKGVRYTVKVPLKTVDGKNTDYYDANFRRIASDPVLFEWYNFFLDLVKQDLSYFPDEEVDELQSNFLPVVTERLAEEYGLTSLKGLTKGLGDWFMNVFTQVEYKKSQLKDPVTGEVVNTIEPKFIDEKVPVEERSKDMVVMLKMFTDMALVYKHKLQVQDYVDSIREIVKNTNTVTEVNQFGEVVGNPSVAPNNLKLMVESEIKKSFYGEMPTTWEIKTKRKFYNPAELLSFGLYKSEKYKQAKQLQSEITELNKQLENEELTEKQASEIQNKIYAKKGEYESLGGRNLSLSRTLDSNIKFTRLLALALQPFSALRNLVIGGVNNVVHSMGGRDFKFDDLVKATSYLKNNVLKFWTKGAIITKDATKLIKFLSDSGIAEGEDGVFKAGIINKKSTAQQIMDKIPNAYTLMKGTDVLFKSQTILAASFNIKINTPKGEFHLYEVMDENLEYNEKEYGPYDPSLNNKKSFEDIYDNFMLKVGQLGKKLHGLSTTRTSLMGKDTIFGRLLFLFRTWLPETLANRYEKKKYDEFLGREIEGYYRTVLADLFGEKGFSAFKDLIRANFSKEVDDMSELELENYRKFGAELVAIATIVAIYFTIKAMAPDDDKDKMWNIFANQTWLVVRDLTYYIDPTSASDLTEQIVPSLRSINTFKDAIKAVIYYELEIENDEGEVQYDSERTLLKVTKAIPVLNNYNRMVYYEKKLTDVR